MAWKQSSSWSPTLLVLAILSSGFGSVASAGEGPSPSVHTMAGIPSGSLTLERAWALARRANPLLKAATLEVEATQGALEQSGVRDNPELSLSQEDTRKGYRTWTAQLDQPLDLSGRRQASMKQAGTGVAIAEADLTLTQAALRAELVRAYYTVLAAQERVELAQRTRQLTGAARDAAANRVAAGKVAPLEQTRAEVEQTAVTLEVSAAESALRVAKTQLTAVLGMPRSDAFQLAGTLEPAEDDGLPDDPSLLALDSPAYVRARRALEAARAGGALEESRAWQQPTVSLGFAREEEAGRNRLIVGVKVPLPLFDRNRGATREAYSRIEQAEAQLLATRSAVAADIYTARERLRTAREQAAHLQQQALPAASQAYDLATRGYALGKFSFLDVVDAQRSLIAIRQKYLDLVLETHLASADIDRLTGGRLDS